MEEVILPEEVREGYIKKIEHRPGLRRVNENV